MWIAADISAQLVAVDSERLNQTVEAALDLVRCFSRADRAVLLAVSDDLVTVHVA